MTPPDSGRHSCAPEDSPGRTPAGADPASGQPGGGWTWAPLLAKLLSTAVIFLFLLIAVVVGGRQLRPLVASWAKDFRERELRDQVTELLNTQEQDTARAMAADLVQKGPNAIRMVIESAATVSEDGTSVRVYRTALKMMAEFSTEVLPVVRQLLEGGTTNGEIAALETLRQMRGAGETMVSRLCTLLTDDNRWVRVYASDVLGQQGSGAAEAVGPLTAALAHQDAHTRRHAAEALGQIGTAAWEAAPALRKLAEEDADSDVRDAAGVAELRVNLPRMAEEAKARANGSIRQLLDKVPAKDQFEAVAALRQLKAKGRAAKDVAPAIAMALQNPNKWIREAAADALGELGKDAKPLSFALRDALNDPEVEVREAAQRALERVEH